MDKIIRTIRVPLAKVKVNPWKKKISGESKDQSRLSYLKESMSEHGIWPGAIGRVVDSHGNLVKISDLPAGLILKDDEHIELANYSHRYWQALELKGPDHVLIVGLGNFSSVDMLKLLASSNRYNEFTEEEATRLLLLVRDKVLPQCPDLSEEFVRIRTRDSNAQPSVRVISKFLGESNWPYPRIYELLSSAKSEGARQESETKNNQPSSRENETAIRPILDYVDSRPEVSEGMKQAAPIPQTETQPNMTSTELNKEIDSLLADVQRIGQPREKTEAKSGKVKSDQERLAALLKNRRKVFQDDLQTRVPESLRRNYIADLTEALQEFNR